MNAAKTLDEAIAYARALTKERSDLLLLIEDLDPEAAVADVAAELGLSAQQFGACHRDNWGRWRRAPSTAEPPEANLPPTFLRFVERYGSFTWLAKDSEQLDGRWFENLPDNGWELLALLDLDKRKALTASFRGYDSGISAGERERHGLDSVIAFSGFVNNAWSFDTRRADASGEYAIVCLDEDEILANTPARDQLDPHEQIASFEQWLIARIAAIGRAAEAVPRRTTNRVSAIQAAFAAIERGASEALAALVARDPSLLQAAHERNKTSLLTQAASENRGELLRVLLDAGAEVDRPDGYGETALARAAKAGALEAVALLAARGASLSTPAGAGSPLYKAIRSRNVEMVERLITLGARPDGEALTCALQECPQLGERLLEAGAPIDADNGVIHLAAIQDDTKLLQLLIARGAKLTGASPRTNGQVPMQFAINQGKSAAIELLVRGGVDVNALIAGWAPLHIAASFQRANVVATLLRLGADPSLQNEDGKSALELVAGKDQKKKQELLRAALAARS